MKKISGYEDLQDAMAYSSVFLTKRDNEESIIKSLEPMEIVIKNSKKETKITLSNRTAEFIEKQDVIKVILAIKDCIKEINKLK